MKTIRFTIQPSHIKKAQGKRAPAILIVPKNVRIPTKGPVPVEGTVNFLPFQSTLQTDSKGNASLRLDARVFEIATRNDSGEIEIEMTKIADETETRVPADLKKAFVRSPKARKTWEDITPLARRDWIFWMITAKQKETRERRIEKMCDMLSSGKRRVCCFAGVAWLMKNPPKKTSRRAARK